MDGGGGGGERIRHVGPVGYVRQSGALSRMSCIQIGDGVPKNQSAFRIRRTLFDFTAFDTERGEFAEKVFVTAVNDFNIIDGADAFGT